MAANSYAVVQTGGKQYSVKPGDVIEVELLTASEGESLDLTDVIAVVQDGKVTVGTPTVPGAVVRAQVQGHGRGDKIIVFHYKAKKRFRRKAGHRQPLTRLAITEIVLGPVLQEVSV